MPDQSPAAFISYSRKDSDFVLRLAQDLKSAGASVWLDLLELKPGTQWDNAIEDALMAAPQMLLVLTPESAKSENVRNEISYALEQGKVIIPVLYMDCVVPLRLQRTQRIDFRTDYALGLASLLSHLHIDRPNPAVLEKAAAEDAQRELAWHARDAEAHRLKEIAERKQQEESDRVAAEESARRQKEAAERQAREAQSQRLKDIVDHHSRQQREESYATEHPGEPTNSWRRFINDRLPLALSITTVVIAILVIALVHIFSAKPPQQPQTIKDAGASSRGADATTGAGPSPASAVAAPPIASTPKTIIPSDHAPKSTQPTSHAASSANAPNSINPASQNPPQGQGVAASQSVVTEQSATVPTPAGETFVAQAKRNACNNGWHDACEDMARFYTYGLQGLPKDPQKAAYFQQKSTEQTKIKY